MAEINPALIPVRIAIPDCLNYITLVTLQARGTSSCMPETVSMSREKCPKERDRPSSV